MAVRALGQEEVGCVCVGGGGVACESPSAGGGGGPLRALEQGECQQGTWAAGAGCCVGQCADWFVVDFLCPLGRWGWRIGKGAWVWGCGGLFGICCKSPPLPQFWINSSQIERVPSHVAVQSISCLQQMLLNLWPVPGGPS